MVVGNTQDISMTKGNKNFKNTSWLVLHTVLQKFSDALGYQSVLWVMSFYCICECVLQAGANWCVSDAVPGYTA